MLIANLHSNLTQFCNTLYSMKEIRFAMFIEYQTIASTSQRHVPTRSWFLQHILYYIFTKRPPEKFPF